ncbi:phospholipase DDHD1 [Schistosoma bovis]|uniref:Phospholipase DDHD1 n=1 Tax=Schistosoma bovis TaxID=6184 RepID=A0A430QEL4_SCHBO|nr:phospholipase DDHD1 [Schistosoma bovis]
MRKLYFGFSSVERCPARILRGTWFREGYGGTLEPFDDESMAERLEAEYITWYLRKPQNIAISDKPLYSNSSLFTRIDVSTPLHSVVSAPTLRYADAIKASELVDENSQSSRSENKDLTIGVENYSDDNVCGSTVLKKRVPCQTIHFTDCHVDCYGENELYLYYESTSLYIRQKLGMQKVGTRLCRGFNDLALKEDKIADVSHLCFVIHGIGQKMGTNLILNNCNELRDTCDKIKTRYFSHLDKENKRVEFLPVEWRTVLQLDGNTVESITPVHLRGLRTVLNCSAMDIMYYTSPLYRAEIICSLKSELNRLYDMFRRLNPDFESRGGKVSIIAHSLGCVLVYDLITGWNQVHDNDPLTEILLNKSTDKNIFFHSASTKLSNITDKTLPNNNLNVLYPDHRLSSNGNLEQIARVNIRLETARTLVNNLEQELSSLLFTRDNHMNCDSQKSNVSNNHQDDQSVYSKPSVCHPNSSLHQQNPLLFADNAYRLEPLILKYYSTIQPALIHRVDAVSKPCYDTLPLLEYSGKEFKHPKPQNCHQQVAKNPCSDTNQLITTQDADSSRRSSIASRLFGFFSRAPYLPGGSQETGGIDLTLSEKLSNHDNDEKINSIEKCSEFCNSTNKKNQKTTNSFTSSLSSNDLFENDLCCYEPLQLECRLDFELQISRYENMYLSLLTSHTSYWTNPDICMFIMTYLFPLKPGSTD